MFQFYKLSKYSRKFQFQYKHFKPSLISHCFSRNKDLLNSVIDDELLDELLVKAGISTNDESRNDLKQEKIDCILEAQRCLYNIYLQCHKSQDLALNNQTLPGIIHQVTKYKDHGVPAQIISFDMKLLFFITAYRPESRLAFEIFHYF